MVLLFSSICDKQGRHSTNWHHLGHVSWAGYVLYLVYTKYVKCYIHRSILHSISGRGRIYSSRDISVDDVSLDDLYVDDLSADGLTGLYDLYDLIYLSRV